ncbi:hypothetical protein BgiMline_009378 [Biomphalaria glabrata]|nr:hypothetical protein BgiMline_023512 [Biomphalaria glabrata]KAI8784976.1 hypothetical protein BgiBS90_014503 [Biomphalaria glabrata]
MRQDAGGSERDQNFSQVRNPSDQVSPITFPSKQLAFAKLPVQQIFCGPYSRAGANLKRWREGKWRVIKRFTSRLKEAETQRKYRNRKRCWEVIGC